MPTYDYECDACGHTFELFQSISESVKKKCPECKKSKLRRLFGTGAAIVFKGSGFYETDYRSESYKEGKKAAEKAKDDSGSKGDKKNAGKSDKQKSGAKASKSSGAKSSGAKSKKSKE